MATNFFDPFYGEMVNINTASKLSGISVHTLRLWRRPEYAHLMKFPHYSSSGSQSVWYRKSEIEAWLETSGTSPISSGLVRADLSAAPEAVALPTIASGSADKYKWLTELGKITTETIERNGDAFAGDYGKIQDQVPDFNAKRRDVMPRLFRLYFGLPEDLDVEYVWHTKKATHPDEWYVGAVLSLRRLLADLKNWDITDQEICDLPIGDYVPLLTRNN